MGALLLGALADLFPANGRSFVPEGDLMIDEDDLPTAVVDFFDQDGAHYPLVAIGPHLCWFVERGVPMGAPTEDIVGIRILPRTECGWCSKGRLQCGDIDVTCLYCDGKGWS